MYSATLSLTSELWGGWSTPRPGRFTTGKEFRYPLYRRLGGPQGRSGRVQKIWPHTGIRSPDSPARSESLYQLSYPGPKSIRFCFVFCGAAAQRGPWPPPHFWGFLITHDASQSVGLLWTSDQHVAETSTWQHTTLTTDRHPCPRWDSNPRSQQASARRPTP